MIGQIQNCILITDGGIMQHQTIAFPTEFYANRKRTGITFLTIGRHPGKTDAIHKV